MGHPGGQSGKELDGDKSEENQVTVKTDWNSQEHLKPMKANEPVLCVSLNSTLSSAVTCRRSWHPLSQSCTCTWPRIQRIWGGGWGKGRFGEDLAGAGVAAGLSAIPHPQAWPAGQQQCLLAARAPAACRHLKNGLLLHVHLPWKVSDGKCLLWEENSWKHIVVSGCCYSLF